MRKLGDRENMIPIDKRCMEKGISRRELARRSPDGDPGSLGEPYQGAP